jgi:hypothetical protein
MQILLTDAVVLHYNELKTFSPFKGGRFTFNELGNTD